MPYDIPPFRPPSEAESLLVRVTRGCTWNKCTFCSMYKSIPFERRPLAEIEDDIVSVRDCCRELARSVFIGDSNSLVIPAGDFVRILRLLYESFPRIGRVTSYARLKTLEKKPLDDLKRLRAAGLTRLHAGLETGNAQLLQRVKKGCTPPEAVTAGIKAGEAGFELSLYVLLGLGGETGSPEHAADTAEVLNRINPHFIRVRTLQPQYGSLLYEDMKAGRFQKAAHATILREQRMLIEKLETASWYLSDHISNYVSVNGKLPEDKQAMLSAIDGYLADIKDDPRLQSSFAGKDDLTQL